MKNEKNVIAMNDLLFSILSGWKWIFAAVVVLALVFGLAQGIAIEKSVGLDARTETQVAYLENSIFMQLDPYNVYEATANLYVTTDGNSMTDDADVLEIAKYACAYYYTALNNNALYMHLTDVTEVMPNYLKELVTLDNSSSPILTVTVCHSSAEQADILLQEILDYAQNEIPAPVDAYHIQADILATVNTVRTDIHAKQIHAQISPDTAMANLTVHADTRMQIVKTAITGGIVGGVLSVLILVVVSLCKHKGHRKQTRQS